jgi:uncharacterized protein YegL
MSVYVSRRPCKKLTGGYQEIQEKGGPEMSDKDLILKKQRMALIQKPTPKVKLSGLAKYKMHNQLVKRRSAVYSNMHWLLDVSGSMSGDKIWQLIDTVEYLLPKYPNVKMYKFASEVRAIAEDAIPHLVASGSTHMCEALETAWNAGADAIVLVTDGDPTDAPKGRIIGEARLHSHIPIHTIGIGEHFSREFLEELSAVTNGNAAQCGTEELLQLTDKFEEVLQLEDRNGMDKKGGPIQL